MYSNSIWVRSTTSTTGIFEPTLPIVTYYVAVNAASSPYAPLVLTYPAGYPTSTPSPLVSVQPLNEYASSGPVIDNQQWAFTPGPVNSYPRRSRLRLRSDCVVTGHLTGGRPRACRPSVL